MAEALKGDKRLAILDVGGNNIGPDGIAALGSALSGHKALKTLELGYNPIGEVGARSLANILKYELAVSPAAPLFLRCGPKRITSWPALLAARICGNMSSSTDVACHVVVRTANFFRLRSSVKSGLALTAEADAVLELAVILSSSRVKASVTQDTPWPERSQLAASLKTLAPPVAQEAVSLVQAGPKVLHTGCNCRVTCVHLQVETLRLGWCKLGSGDGAAAVADLLLFNASLVTVDLRGNGFGDSGAIHIARALRELTTEKLAELDLGYNEIKDDGACQLALVRCRLARLCMRRLRCMRGADHCPSGRAAAEHDGCRHSWPCSAGDDFGSITGGKDVG